MRRILMSLLLATALASTFAPPLTAQASSTANVGQTVSTVHYRSVDIDGVNVFYREAGPADGPVVLLLHGFPTSSHMLRNLNPL